MRVITRADAARLDLKRYFTGKPCKYGHVCERDVRCRTCIECKKIRVRTYLRKRRRDDPDYARSNLPMIKQWRAENPERAKAAEKVRRQRPEVLERERVRLKKHNATEAAKAAVKAWRQAHPERQREYDRRKRERNPDGRAALLKKLASDPIYRKARDFNRAARKRGASNNIPSQDLANLATAADGICTGCQQPKPLEFDHIKSLARGGLHAITNLQMLCGPCNREKGVRDPVEWARSIGRADLANQYSNLEIAA